jgi:hypothetical protein
MEVVLDQAKDHTGQELHRITSLYEPPTFVKNASYDSICGDPQTLPVHIYADTCARRLPCHTSASTWMSTAFFADKQACYPIRDAKTIEEKLVKAAKYHGILNEVTGIFEKAAKYNTSDKATLPDTSFAFVWQKNDGTKERHLPLRNKHEVKRAADYIFSNRDEFTYDDRRTIAQKILVKSAEFAVNLEDRADYLEKQAGQGACSGKIAAGLLDNRAGLVNNHNAKTQLKAAACALRANPIAAHAPEKMQKLASFVDTLDREFGIVSDYGPRVPRPEDVLFTVNEKTAAQFKEAHVPLTSGNIYKVADLKQVKLGDIRDWMGSEFADEISAGGLYVNMDKLAELLPTLPRGDAERFDTLLSGQGIQPFAKEAAHESVGISQQDLFALAAGYNAQV